MQSLWLFKLFELDYNTYHHKYKGSKRSTKMDTFLIRSLVFMHQEEISGTLSNVTVMSSN